MVTVYICISVYIYIYSLYIYIYIYIEPSIITRDILLERVRDHGALEPQILSAKAYTRTQATQARHREPRDPKAQYQY